MYDIRKVSDFNEYNEIDTSWNQHFFEHGFAGYSDDDTIYCVIGSDMNENGFCTFYKSEVSKEDIQSFLLGNEWADRDDIKGFFSFIGIDTFKEMYRYIRNIGAYTLHDLVGYWGIDDFCAAPYWKGDYFHIIDTEYTEPAEIADFILEQFDAARMGKVSNIEYTDFVFNGVLHDGRYNFSCKAYGEIDIDLLLDIETLSEDIYIHKDSFKKYYGRSFNPDAAYSDAEYNLGYYLRQIINY